MKYKEHMHEKRVKDSKVYRLFDINNLFSIEQHTVGFWHFLYWCLSPIGTEVLKVASSDCEHNSRRQVRRH